MRRHERLERQDDDDGDPDDTVFVVQAPRATGKGEAYHADADCAQRQPQTDSVQTMTRQNAQERWFCPCRACVLDDVDRRNGATSGDVLDGRTGGLADLDPSDLGLEPNHR